MIRPGEYPALDLPETLVLLLSAKRRQRPVSQKSLVSSMPPLEVPLKIHINF